MVRTNRPSRPCQGLAGGQPGALSLNILNPGTEDVALPQQTHLHLEVKPGDRVFHAISGSGGHGDPWQREPEQVLRDVHDEKVTVEAAREQYGVVIDLQNFTIDWQQTHRLRQSGRANELRTALG
jgi:N-methylhydantoinase B/oxoprolinase/acetone carboxylase alpha subunit